MATITHTVNRDARVASTLGSGACDHLDAGPYGGYTYYTWLAFTGESWTGIPNADAITSATVSLYAGTQYHVARSAGTLTVRHAGDGVIFTEGTVSEPMSTSNAITGSNDPAVTGASATGSYADSNGWKTVTITSLIKEIYAYSGRANYALRIASSDPVEFNAREAGSYDAKVVITYNANSAPYAPSNLSISTTLDDTTPTLSFTVSDPDGDTMPMYTFEIATNPAVDANGNFTTGRIEIECNVVTGSFPSGSTQSVTIANALNPGGTYYWHVISWDTDNGLGPWSSTASFTLYSLPTVALTFPSGTGQLARMYIAPGAGGTPYPQWDWSYSDANGHPQQSAVIGIWADSGGVQGGFVGSNTVTQSTYSYLMTGYTPSNGTYFWVSMKVFCTGGCDSGYTTPIRTRARWGCASYYRDMGATAPVAWDTPTYNLTQPANTLTVIEYAATSHATSASEPSTWYANMGDVPIPTQLAHNYVWHRVTLMAWGASPTSPTLNDISLRWSNSGMSLNLWNHINGQYASLDSGNRVFGTKSLKHSGPGGVWCVSYQVVDVTPNTLYTLQGRIKSLGHAHAYYEISDAAGTVVITNTATVDTTTGWTRYSVTCNSGAASQLQVRCVSYTDAGAYAWFDAVKFEASSLVNPWSPGFVAGAAVVDAGGIQVDGRTSAGGGIFRLLGSNGGERDLVELGSSGLVFGGATSAPMISSPASGQLRVSSDTGTFLAVVGQGTNDPILGLTRSGDGYWRAQLHASAGGAAKPGLLLGDGTNAPDIALYRESSTLLYTPDIFEAAGAIISENYLQSYGNVYVGGNVHWGPSNSWDVNLYRGGSNLLKTDDTFEAAAVSAPSLPTAIPAFKGATGDNSNIGTSVADTTGATVTFTPAVAETVLVTAQWDVVFAATGSTSFTGSLWLDGSQVTTGLDARYRSSGASDRTTVVGMWIVTLTANTSHTIKLRHVKSAAAATVDVSYNNTGFTYTRFKT